MGLCSKALRGLKNIASSAINGGYYSPADVILCSEYFHLDTGARVLTTRFDSGMKGCIHIHKFDVEVFIVIVTMSLVKQIVKALGKKK
jgi:hypothetical protein